MDAAQDTTATRQKTRTLIAEIDPPKGVNLDSFLSTAQQIRGRVESVRVTDCEHAIMRMSPIAPCLSLKNNGYEPEMIITGRDRNRISFQADLLSAAALGIKNIVIKEGNDPAEGDQPVVRTSGDLDLVSMLECVSALNSGKDLGGEALDGATEFKIGVALELSDDVNLNRARAEFFKPMQRYGVSAVTLGPTYDLNIIEPFLQFSKETGIELFASVMFLKSVTMVRYLNNLPGVPSIPQEFLKKMINAPVKKDAGLQAAAELMAELASLTSGTVLLAMGGKDRLPEFLDLIGR
jgi:5,10-methylenetetrahydrofolate reductase